MTQLTQSILNSAKNDKFIMVVNNPKCMKNIIRPLQTVTTVEEANMDSFQFSIMNIPLPTIQINNETLHYSGGNLNLSTFSRSEFPELNVSAIVNNKYTNWWFIYKWMNMILDAKYAVPDKEKQYVNIENFKPEDYFTDITVYGLDEMNKQVIKWDYKYCHPISIGEYRNAAEFAYNGNPTDIVCGIKFKYSYFTCEPVNVEQ